MTEYSMDNDNVEADLGISSEIYTCHGCSTFIVNDLGSKPNCEK